MPIIVTTAKAAAKLASRLISYGVIPAASAGVEFRELNEEHNRPVAIFISSALVMESAFLEGANFNNALSFAVENPSDIASFIMSEVADLPRIPGLITVIYCAGGEFLLSQQALRPIIGSAASYVGGAATALGYFVLELEETASFIEHMLKQMRCLVCPWLPRPHMDTHDFSVIAANEAAHRNLDTGVAVIARFNSLLGSMGFHAMKGFAVYKFMNKSAAGLALGSLLWGLNLIVSQGLGARKTGLAIQHFKQLLSGFVDAPNKLEFLKERFEDLSERYEDWPAWLVVFSLAIPMMLAPAGAYAWAVVNKHGVQELFSFLLEKVQASNDGKLTGVQKFFLQGGFVSTIVTIAAVSGGLMNLFREGEALFSGIYTKCLTWHQHHRTQAIKQNGYGELVDDDLLIVSVSEEDDSAVSIEYLEESVKFLPGWKKHEIQSNYFPAPYERAKLTVDDRGRTNSTSGPSPSRIVGVRRTL